jgi:hypothetical protein
MLGTLALLAGGCATLPTSGQPHAVTGATAPAPDNVQLLPPSAPDPAWLPQQVVTGFLHASAYAFASAPQVAREYLARNVRANWHPSKSVTVIGTPQILPTSRIGPQNANGGGVPDETVRFRAAQLANLTTSGQYVSESGSRVYQFSLENVNGRWLIQKYPPGPLLLTRSDFQQAYLPQVLYFYGPSGAMVPDPVFVPQGSTSTELADDLVGDLRSDPGGWLAGAARTAFPPGSRAIGPVGISGSTAQVNLGGAAARAGPAELRRMAAQLVLTLTSQPYSAPLARSVVLEVNGRRTRVSGQFTSYQSLLPGSGQGSGTAYFLGSNGALSELNPAGGSRLAPGPGGLSRLAAGSIAVSPGQRPELAVTVASRPGCVIYHGPLASTGRLSRWRVPGPEGSSCAALSWDASGALWAATNQSVWVLTRAGQPVPVGGLPPGRILALRVAPDGVRVAMIVQGRGGVRRLLVAASSRSSAGISLGPPVVIGGNVTGATALNWYGPSDLLVLAHSQLYQVPLNGAEATSVEAVEPGVQTVTTDGSALVAATRDGEILQSPGLNSSWRRATRGRAPAFAG